MTNDVILYDNTGTTLHLNPQPSNFGPNTQTTEEHKVMVSIKVEHWNSQFSLFFFYIKYRFSLFFKYWNAACGLDSTLCVSLTLCMKFLFLMCACIDICVCQCMHVCVSLYVCYVSHYASACAHLCITHPYLPVDKLMMCVHMFIMCAHICALYDDDVCVCVHVWITWWCVWAFVYVHINVHRIRPCAHMCGCAYVTVYIRVFSCVYVTGNLCNQGIPEIPEWSSEFANSLKLFREFVISVMRSAIKSKFTYSFMVFGLKILLCYTFIFMDAKKFALL